jgi:hypothetical protein
MGKDWYRRQVTGKTTKGEPISIPRVSANNGNSVVNASAKGCFGKSTAEKKGYKSLSPYKMKQFKKAQKARIK